MNAMDGKIEVQTADKFNPGNPWTPERVEKLKALHAEGKSASIIAGLMSREFGHHFSRNAVIGKIVRLGLAGRTTQRPRKARLAAPKPKRPRVTLAGGEQVEQKPTHSGHFDRWAGARMEQDTAGPIAALPSDDVWSPLKDTRPIRMAALGLTSCRWPVEDGKKRFGLDRLSCGAETRAGEPYCEVHANQSMAPHRRAG